MQYYTRRRDGTVGELLYAVKFGKTVHRERGDIPGILKAQDVFVEEDGHLTIKNPSKPYRPAY